MMTEPAYPFHISNNALNYDFESVSDQKTIIKSVQFKPFPDNALFYNLGLGDRLADGSVTDSVVSNNQDMNRIMATVFQTLLTFFERYPLKLVYFQGSDKEGIRTRLYRILISRELEKATELFTIYGRFADNSVEDFTPNREYIGFIFQRKSG